MSILGNYSVLQKSPGRFLSGTVASDRSNYSKSGDLKNRYADGGTFPKFSALPNGYVHPYSWSMAQVSGGLAAYRLEAETSETDALLARGLNMTAALTADIQTVEAALALIVALEAALSASGQLTDTNLAIILQMQAALTASGTITTGLLGNIVNMAASLAGQGLLTDVALVNLVNLAADITSQTELSPESLARSVWNALIVDFQEPGSTGEALNNAGSAGNPWDALLAANNDPGTFGERVQKLLTVAKFLGLK